MSSNFENRKAKKHFYRSKVCPLYLSFLTNETVVNIFFLKPKFKLRKKLTIGWVLQQDQDSKLSQTHKPAITG